MLARQNSEVYPRRDNTPITEPTASTSTPNAADGLASVTTVSDVACASSGVDELPVKKARTSLFANYKKATMSGVVNHELQLTKYLATINSTEFDPDISPNLFISPEYICLRCLFSRFFFQLARP